MVDQLGSPRVLRVLTFVLIVNALGVACRENLLQAPTPTLSVASPTAGSLVLSLWHSENDVGASELESLVREFESTHPGIRISTVRVGTQAVLGSQIMAAIALSQAPDLVIATRPNIARFARLGGLLPLDDFTSDPATGFSSDDVTDFLPGILDEGTYNDLAKQTYSIPFDEEALVLFYNSDLLNGLNYDTLPSSWDQFGDMAEKATAGGNFGWEMRIRAEAFGAILVSQNSSLLDSSERTSLFSQPVGITAMTLISRLTKSGAARPETDGERALLAFAAGHAAFYIDWMSRGSDLDRLQHKQGSAFVYGLSRLPGSAPEHPALLIRGNDLAISKTSPERGRAAWSFVRWLMEAEQVSSWARETRSLPVRASVFARLAADSSLPEASRTFYESFGGQIPRCAPYPAARHMDAVEKLVEDAWRQVAFDKLDVSAALDGAAARADSVLSSSQ